MKLTIENHTRWRTDDLRRICAAAAKRVGIKLPKLVIVTSNSTLNAVHGRGAYPTAIRREGRYIKLTIPTPEKCAQVEQARTCFGRDDAFQYAGRDPALAKQVAQVAAHEFMHNLGSRHKDMTPDQRYCRQRASWADSLPLRVVQKRARKTESPSERGSRLRTERAEHARAMLKRATTKLKRAKTIETKWRDKVKYYERQEKAAAGKADPHG